MNLKYYLRGLGIGIVVTAFLMGFALGGTKEKLSDEEILARAEQLGMVESGVLSKDLDSSDADAADKKETTVAKTDTAVDKKETTAAKTDTAADKKETTAAKTDTAADKKETTAVKNDTAADKKETTAAKTDTAADKKETTAAKTDTAADKKESTAVKTDTAADTNNEKTYTVTVHNGDDSMNVANRMQQMGIIKDAAAFDAYLCQNGYDKRLATGNHTIKEGMTEKELADALIRSAN